MLTPRRRGTAADGRAARTALDRGLIPQYRPLAGNASSVGISRTLDVLPYGACLAGRPRLESLAE